MSPQEGDKTRIDRIRQIRPDLDQRAAEKVAADEALTRKAVERSARDDSERGGFLGMLFGRSK